MNINVLKLLFVIGIFSLIAPQRAFAYLDPGTGSMIIQLIVASFAGIGCAIAVWKDKIIKVFKKGPKDD